MKKFILALVAVLIATTACVNAEAKTRKGKTHHKTATVQKPVVPTDLALGLFIGQGNANPKTLQQCQTALTNAGFTLKDSGIGEFPQGLADGIENSRYYTYTKGNSEVTLWQIPSSIKKNMVTGVIIQEDCGEEASKYLKSLGYREEMGLENIWYYDNKKYKLPSLEIDNGYDPPITSIYL